MTLQKLNHKIVKKNNKLEKQECTEIENKYKNTILPPRELYILDAILKDRNKSEIAKELGICLATVYNIMSRPQFQNVLMKEMQYKYEVMKNTRIALFNKIADKALNILFYIMDEIEREELNREYGSYIKTKEILYIVGKVIYLMQLEDGIKQKNFNVTANINNLNLNANAALKELDLQDVKFREYMADFC
jgi:Response regulator containing a CheY-like receiver domain and an HTH DNA-binding domain